MSKYTDKLCGMDAYGRYVPTQNGKKTDKEVGIFYFCWLGDMGNKIHDIQKLLDGTPDETLWSMKGPDESPFWGFHFWGEPLLGYYDCKDDFVIKTHLEMLTAAGIDYIACDCTNAIIYPEVYMKLLQNIDRLQKEGKNPPKICAYTNSSSVSTVRTLYAAFYEKKNLFPDAWYAPNGKPVVIARLDENDDRLEQEILDRFDVRKSQWPNEKIYSDGFPWMEWCWPQPNHNGFMSVSVAQHSKGTFFQCEGNWGRGYDHKGNENHDCYRLGQNFQAQWDTALSDPTVKNVFVTGWNEWGAQKINLGGDIIFVDCCNEEYSRDIEPMKGGYEDAFYLQLIRNVRRFKGQTENEEKGCEKTIDIYGDDSQWDGVTAQYLPISDKTYGRVFASQDPDTVYKQAPAENNITEIKVAHDADFLYFRITTEDPVTERKNPSWMNLFIGAGKPHRCGWETYSHVVNRRCVGSFDALNMSGNTVSYRKTNVRIDANRMYVAIPRADIGADGNCKSIYFKVSDSVENFRDINDYYVSGKSVPMGRLSFLYNF